MNKKQEDPLVRTGQGEYERRYWMKDIDEVDGRWILFCVVVCILLIRWFT